MKSSTQDSTSEMWGGRFASAPKAFVTEFTASISFDSRLLEADIEASIAHVKMLNRVEVLSEEESQAIERGLGEILEEAKSGLIEWSIDLEDIHMNVEALLIDKIGDVAKKMHTARSRNDQVATDIRLFLRSSIDALLLQVDQLLFALLDISEREIDTILPGCTHLQPAQPVLLAHHLMAWFSMLQRDRERLIDIRKRVNQLPLGSAALAGTTFPIDRSYVAELLAFEGVIQNSIDAVSDRDFVIEFISAASLMMMHFSRWSEEIIFWATPQYGFVDLPDDLCTGSSIMPQKKNPDLPELIRGKSGRVFGHLMSMLTLMKGQPLAYNKDNQEDKEPLFDSIDTLSGSMRALQLIMEGIQFNRKVMLESTLKGFTTATDLADYLVRKNIPFRDAHHMTGSLVKMATEKSCLLSDLSLQEMCSVAPQIEMDIFDILTLEGSVMSREHEGGTAKKSVMQQIRMGRSFLNKV